MLLYIIHVFIIYATQDHKYPKMGLEVYVAQKNYNLVNECNHDFRSNNYYVYLLVNPVTLQPFYVGKGTGDRAWKHISLRNNIKIYNTNPHKNNTINKIVNGGHAVVIRVVDTCNTEEEAFDIEQLLISLYGRRCNNTGCLTNISLGGEGYTHDGIPVCQYTIWGTFVKEYKNAKEAARVNGWKNYNTICSCCKKKERSYRGFLWAYAGEYPVTLKVAKPVYQWTFEGELVQIHRNASAGARAVKCDPSTINDCVKGYNRLAVGYLWSYTNIQPLLKRSKNVRPVKHINTGHVYSSVTDAAKTTAHAIGDVSGCCNGRKKKIGADMFCYVDDQ